MRRYKVFVVLELQREVGRHRSIITLIPWSREVEFCVPKDDLRFAICSRRILPLISIRRVLLYNSTGRE